MEIGGRDWLLWAPICQQPIQRDVLGVGLRGICQAAWKSDAWALIGFLHFFLPQAKIIRIDLRYRNLHNEQSTLRMPKVVKLGTGCVNTHAAFCREVSTKATHDCFVLASTVLYSCLISFPTNACFFLHLWPLSFFLTYLIYFSTLSIRLPYFDMTFWASFDACVAYSYGLLVILFLVRKVDVKLQFYIWSTILFSKREKLLIKSDRMAAPTLAVQHWLSVSTFLKFHKKKECLCLNGL